MHCCYNSTKGQRESGDSEFKLTAKFKSFSFYLLSLPSYRNQGACYLEQFGQRKKQSHCFLSPMCIWMEIGPDLQLQNEASRSQCR